MSADKMKIAEGDTVSVNVHGGQYTVCHRAKVLHMPCATGDSWIFEDLDSGDIHYVSEGCTVSRKKSNATLTEDEK